jgi:phage baseplate assembly protein W
MSTLEKNLYKRINVDTPQSKQRASASTTYRSISTVNPESDGFKLYDLAVIKQDIINHFHIRQGEKLENPEFGTIIWDVLFDPLTENLKSAIVENVEDIINYDPRVQVDQVIVDEYESGIQIECVLIYLEYSIAETMRLQFDQDNGLLS